MKVPDWMTGGDPRQLQSICDWQMDAAHGALHSFLVRTKEGQHGKSAKFFRFEKLVDARNGHDLAAYSRLNRLKGFDGIVPSSSWETAREVHGRLAEDHAEEATALLMSMRVLVTAAPSAKVAMEALHRSFSEWLLPAAPEASCFLIEISEILGYRYSVTRALLNTHAPDQLKTAADVQEILFGSARGLFSDATFGLSAYLDCLCSSLSPDVWAFAIGRPGAVVLLLFGRAMSAQSNLPLDKIQLLAPSLNSIARSADHVMLTPVVFVKAARWWVQQLNVLFSIATEPANHGRDGLYDPSMALEKLLTLEQVFRDCQSIATVTRDQHARISLAFQALVRFQGLVPSLNWKKVAGVAEARATLSMLRAKIPPEIQPVFLPRAEKAVNALEELERGFVLANLAGVEGIRLPRQDGSEESIARAQAVTEWLQLYRNSLHGFDKNTTPRQRALLAAHDGVVPGEVADLAWLQLLALVAKPESMARFRRARD